MAHYALLDARNIVIQVIVGKDEHEPGPDGEPWDWETYYGGKRTSYNTRGGEHVTGGEPFRKNYAGVGFTYDPARDAFIPPQPFASWVLNEQTCLWDAPVPMPAAGGPFVWSEVDGAWVVSRLSPA
jgi:hypothetical protein